jgi:general stress protein 26
VLSAGTRESWTHVSEQGSIERIWDVVEKVGVCMLTTVSAGKLRARPVEARPDRESGVIFVVTDVDSAKGDEIERKPDVGLVFSDTKAKAYLSITARACVVNDRSELARAWKMTDRVWWRGGPTDPGVCLLRIEPQAAELWDGPASTASTLFQLAKAWLTGVRPALGENRKVTVNM